MSFLISLIVFLIIASVCLYIVRLTLASFPIKAPFGNLIYALIVLLVLLVFLNEVGFMGPAHTWRAWR